MLWSVEYMMNSVKKVAHNIKELDKRLIRKFQQKFDLSDYQIICLAFAKGFVIGAILL